MRIITDYMRVDELCKDPEKCYFDWDVFIGWNFNIKDTPHPQVNSMGDNIMYSGDTEFWKRVRELMGDINDHKNKLGVIFNVLSSKKIVVNPESIISNVGWSHMNYSRVK